MEQKAMNEPTTLQEAIIYFSDPNNCREYLVARRWPMGVTCPRCGSENVLFLENYNRWHCREKHPAPQFTLKTGSIMEDSPIGLDKWLMAMWLVVNCKNGVSSYEIHRAIGVTQKTAWFLNHRIRLAFGLEPSEKLSGHVYAMANLKIPSLPTLLTLIISAMVLLSGCAGPTSLVSSVNAQAPVCPGQILDTAAYGLHGWGACQMPGSTTAYAVGVEAQWNSTGTAPNELKFPLTFPSGQTITELDGTLSYYSTCDWPAPGLGNVVLVSIYLPDGSPVKSYGWVIKGAPGQAYNLVIHNTLNIPTNNGAGAIYFDVQPPPGCLINVELQAQMNIK
jgi:hypothetical protein